MSLRTRMLLAFGVAVLVPLALLALGLRHEMINRISDEYQIRVNTVAEVIREDLQREKRRDQRPTRFFKESARERQPFPAGGVAGVESERQYLLDYAGSAMRLTGLSMCRFRIMMGASSAPAISGTNTDSAEPAMTKVLTDVPDGVALFTDVDAGARVPLASARRVLSHRGPDVYARHQGRQSIQGAGRRLERRHAHQVRRSEGG